MRIFAVAADVVMGVILGIFLYAVVIRLWPALGHPGTALAVIVAAIVVVLFRQPYGTLAARRDRT